jgi:hypothetical protein
MSAKPQTLGLIFKVHCFKFSYLEPYTPLISKPKLFPKPQVLDARAVAVSGAMPKSQPCTAAKEAHKSTDLIQNLQPYMLSLTPGLEV